MTTVFDLAKALQGPVPEALAAPWDHVGLQVGDPAARVRKLMIALDPSPDVVKRAIKRRCELLITHHPLYLRPPERLNFSEGPGKVIALALQHKLSIYAAHTNLDAAHGGLNDYLCDLLELEERSVLVPLSQETISAYKLVTFIPIEHVRKVSEALFDAGAGHIGNYERCSFRSVGSGTYLGNDESTPSIGKRRQWMQVKEERLEVLVPAASRVAVERALRATHPYEEVAFDWIPLAAESLGKAGLGRLGVLKKAIATGRYLKMLKRIFRVKAFRFVGSRRGTIRRVALCSGSGASFIALAAQAKADLYITGDVKYHDALTAQSLGLSVADLGHFATEHWAVDLLAKMVHLQDSTVTIYKDRSQKDPFIYL